ncbi:E3 ubiquitin-protein ligase rnf146 isoform X2 [Tribolium castaneum]|uniref:E3 ubiquitin-protein ligase rnf146 isoform X2 n=1 Tax=Tribolium castaneum TaxID=7070 RepID=UPI000175810B|nr:PREDICTED: E3 ubiquitin-protein ligase rnf146 isoform X2 [Tribolium castaneum]XP_015834014.1 PREDICTED: E3 ubiquitin-protein ligase rnf146 isoform X2 [Tribolium castaneum]|eukprot:XP_015834013.1 PREDICTED: E3 ubiquitin-protein ligase rnf146 isoform X2 [Tribolium castaneum]
MAEASRKSQLGGPHTKEATEKGDNLECAVCLQNCVHPAQLPCGHIFCFLCVKGIANQSKKCAMCRQEIPKDFIEQPNLLEKPYQREASEGFDGGYQWFYEGKNGWWRYDPRTNEDIEQAFQLNLPLVEILICGEIYVIDITNNWQYCKKTPTRKRSIKRDKIENLVVKGEAGLLR